MADNTLWQKILAAKQEAEADYPMDSHQTSWEERDMHIFGNMVKAATGQWQPKQKSDDSYQGPGAGDDQGPADTDPQPTSLLDVSAKPKPAAKPTLKE